jgi:hypothetical protein
MSKNLQIELLKSSVNGEVYDAAMECLILQNSDKAFTFKIKEMADFAPNKPVAPKLMKELNEKEFYALSIESRWGHNAKIKEQDEKVNAYNKKHDEYNKNIKALRASVSWAWQLVGNGVNPKTISPNASFARGITKDNIYSLRFPKIAEGGGLVWLEVFTDDDPAVGRPPFGMFVQAKGTPKIIRVEWTDQNYNPIPDTEILAFGSQVLLHIYTNGMYGQEVEIELFDKDIFSGDDTLSIGDKKAFTREVLVQEIKPFEEGKYGNSGFLIASKQNENNKVIEGDTVVQKIEIKVSIQKNWMKDGGTELKIYPAIKSVETGNNFTEFTRQFLTVKENGIMYNVPAIPTNNTPGMVGSVETNVATFKPCRYDKITLMQQNKAGSTIVFNSGDNMQRAKKSIAIEIVAGKKETCLLDFDFQTLECERKPKHTTKEITILTIPKDYELKIDPSSKAEHKVKKEENGLTKTESSRNSSIMGMKTTQKETVAIEKGIVTVRQKQIEFDTFYNYDIPQDANAATTFYKAMKYFWLPNLSADKINNITAVANTCAFQQNVNIAIYPDIKWTLKFGFNVEKDDIEKLNRKGGTFAPLKTFEDKAEEKDKAYFEKHKKQKETLERAEKHFTDKYNLKPKATAAPVEKGTSFKQLLEILQRITISLEEQHYGGDVKNELTEDFVKQLYEQAKTVIDLAKIGVELLEGKHDESNYTPEDDRNIDGLAKKLARKPVAYEFLYPKLSFAGSWFYEQIDAKEYPELAGRQGLGVDLMLNAAPLIGVTIKWDILELLCRRHPIAYAILKAIDALLYILADDSSAVKCDFSVTGKIETTIDLQHNMLAGFKDFNVKGKSAIQTEIILELKLNNSIKLGKFEVLVKRGVSAGASIGLGIEDVYGVDGSGIYIKKDLVFEGIKFSFEAEGSAELGTQEGKRKKKSMFKLGGEITGEITMLAHTFSTDKMYINKTS